MQAILEACYEYTKIQGIYVNRGDMAAWDFTEPDFTSDGTWRDLDLSAIVPEHAKAVHIAIAIKNAAVGADFTFRRNGNVNTLSVVRSGTQVANVTFRASHLIPIDTNRIIEYNLSNLIWVTHRVMVIGWIF